MLGLLLALSASAGLDDQLLYSSDVAPPPGAHSDFSVVDTPDFVIVRPDASSFRDGLTVGQLELVVQASLQDRTADYDFVVVVHTAKLPEQMSAAASYQVYNNGEQRGTGAWPRSTPWTKIRGVLWMNNLDYWDSWGDVGSGWVFNQELSHHWLAFVGFDQGDGPSGDLLGRQNGHWSYYLNTPNSPQEGNAWIDNKDGTFTTDLTVEPTFSSLDLYLMGLIPPQDVPDFYYIADPESRIGRGATPRHQRSDTPVTVRGTRVDVSVDDVISAMGERSPASADSPKSLRLLTAFVVGPNELVDNAAVERVLERQTQWTAAWSQMTLGLSSVSFAIEDEGRWVPALTTEPTLIPRGAW